jgi:hypothetical protein
MLNFTPVRKLPNDIARQIRSQLPSDKKEASWGYLAEKFPWWPMVHLLRAAEHPGDKDLLQKAALYHPDILRLNIWLKLDKPGNEPQPSLQQIAEPEFESPSDSEIITDNAEIKQAETESAAGGSGAVWEEKNTIQEEEKTESVSGKAMEKPKPLVSVEIPDDLLIPITPYHTIDYFASQGIKAEKLNPNGESTPLDRQVKSFTDWLKTMKKLKYQPATAYTDPLVEVKAKASVHQKEVLTEAMAEVWLKQGDLDKAEQVYTKLMLLHPEKTPYFAARLKELKEKQ